MRELENTIKISFLVIIRITFFIFANSSFCKQEKVFQGEEREIHL